MRIESERLGTLEVDEASVITFPRGLIGLPDRRRFVILEFGEGIPLGWMQSVDDGSFGLPVSDPQIFRPDYRVEASSPDVSDLELESAEDAVILRQPVNDMAQMPPGGPQHAMNSHDHRARGVAGGGVHVFQPCAGAEIYIRHWSDPFAG